MLARPAVARRPHARAGRQAHRLGRTPTVRTRSTGRPSATATCERMEAQVERFAPGFRERILARHVLAPADLQARNANLVGGDVGGGSYALAQVLFRPVRSLAPYRTPVRGLYIGSAADVPGRRRPRRPGPRRRAAGAGRARVERLTPDAGRGTARGCRWAEIVGS